MGLIEINEKHADDIEFTTKNRQKAKEAGINDHLSKPLDAKKMLSVITKHMKS